MDEIIQGGKRVSVAEFIERPDVKRLEATLRKLTTECTAYYNGICAKTDEVCTYHELGFIGHKRCMTFENGVLPTNKPVQNEYWSMIAGETSTPKAKSTCETCGKPYNRISPRQKYCPTCGVHQERLKKRGRDRKYRQKRD